MVEQSKIEVLERKIKKLESKINKKNSLNKEYEGLEKEESSDDISRRDFLKKAGLGAVGLAAILSPIQALNIRSRDLRFYGGEDQSEIDFQIDGGGDLEVNGDVDINNNNIKNLSRLNGEDINDLTGSELGWEKIESHVDDDESSVFNYDSGALPEYDIYLVEYYIINTGESEGTILCRVDGETSNYEYNYHTSDGISGREDDDYYVLIGRTGSNSRNSIGEFKLPGDTSFADRGQPSIHHTAGNWDDAEVMLNGRNEGLTGGISEIRVWTSTDSRGKLQVYGKNIA